MGKRACAVDGGSHLKGSGIVVARLTKVKMLVFRDVRCVVRGIDALVEEI